MNFKILRVIRFTIPVPPKTIQFGSRYGRGHFYSDPEKVKYLDSIKEESSHHAPESPHLGPVGISISFYLKKGGWVKSDGPDNPAWQSGMDDDNVYKGTKDGLTKAGFWRNDSQVCDSRIKMRWAEDDLFPRIEVVITLYEIPEGNCPQAIKKLLKERATEGRN